MEPDLVDKRLNQISTVWTLVRRAHSSADDVRTAAQVALLERYQRAIYRYLARSLNQDYDAADEVFQDFTLRFVRGDFKGADPGRGRFRDYVKRAILNLIIDHQKQMVRHRDQGAQAPDHLDNVAAPGDDPEEQFLQCWRKELLDRAWEALATAANPDGPPFYEVLRRSCEDGQLTSEELARQLTAELQPARPFTDAGVRKVLQRAREKFGSCLLAEVSRSLETSGRQALEEELRALGFWMFCRKALEAREG